MRNPITWLLISCLVFSFTPPPEFKKYMIDGTAQGTTYHIVYFVAADSLVAKAEIDSILDNIDSSLSLYKSWSLISQFNQANEKVRMDDHFRKVIKRSLEIAADSKGIFDITVFPLVDAWGFGPARRDSLPDDATIKAIKPCVGSDFLTIKGDYLYKTKPCVKLDVNGIAQGYSVDVLADFMESKGIRNYLVELGGELRVKGRKQPGNLPIQIGIEAPPDNEFTDDGLEKIIAIDDGAITTSGSYRKFRESNGKKISHIIDPRTGYPSVNELISVTVYAKDAITADGYDNVLMVMGLDESFRFVEKRKDLAAWFIYRQKDGRLADTATHEFYKLLQR